MGRVIVLPPRLHPSRVFPTCNAVFTPLSSGLLVFNLRGLFRLTAGLLCVFGGADGSAQLFFFLVNLSRPLRACWHPSHVAAASCRLLIAVLRHTDTPRTSTRTRGSQPSLRRLLPAACMSSSVFSLFPPSCCEDSRETEPHFPQLFPK